MQWTTEQESVINHTAGNLLVAAAAGSGKTAVLVQHVISRIMDPVDPVKLSEMVIMTFTEAAAQEMRDRIKAALEEKLREHPDSAELIREAGSIQNASISTIDAFCKHFITENYAAIDLDPGFRMGDQGELRLLQGDILEDLLEEEYAAGEEDFLHFVDTFAQGKTDAGIAELIQKLYESAASHPWPEEYLDACLTAESADGKKFLLEQLAARLRDDAERMDYALSICAEPDGPESYLPNVAQEKQALRYAAEATELQGLVLRTQAIRYERLKPTKSALKGRVTAIRDDVKKDTKDIAGLPVVLDPEAEARMEAGIERCMHGLVRLTKKFSVRYQEEKEKRHVLDFSDLEHKALEILYTTDADGIRHPSAIADDVAQQYREILVDEYQDSNFVQEELIRALSAERFGRPDVFQVGDVKQSIYSFRQARPDLFLMKYQDPDYPKIELSRNFRSRNEVVRAVNRVFHRVMRPMLGGIDYNEKVALHYGYPKAPESEEIDPRYQTELLLLEVSKETSEELFGAQMSKEEAEAHMIAERIQRLHADGVKYRDMVILLRSPGSWADTLVEILGADGVPAYCTSNEGYFDTVEVETVLALLDVIDNPQQDIPLAAVLHSPIYQFTDEELAELVAHFGSLRAALPQLQLSLKLRLLLVLLLQLDIVAPLVVAEILELRTQLRKRRPVRLELLLGTRELIHVCPEALHRGITDLRCADLLRQHRAELCRRLPKEARPRSIGVQPPDEEQHAQHEEANASGHEDRRAQATSRHRRDEARHLLRREIEARSEGRGFDRRDQYCRDATEDRQEAEEKREADADRPFPWLCTDLTEAVQRVGVLLRFLDIVGAVEVGLGEHRLLGRRLLQQLLPARLPVDLLCPYLRTQRLELPKLVLVLRLRDFALDVPDLADQLRVGLRRLRHPLRLQRAPLLSEQLQCPGGVERHIAGRAEIRDVGLQLVHHAAARRASQLPDRHRVLERRLGNPAQHRLQEAPRIRHPDARRLVPDFQRAGVRAGRRCCRTARAPAARQWRSPGASHRSRAVAGACSAC